MYSGDGAACFGSFASHAINKLGHYMEELAFFS
jgi:hypothetical protein